MLAIVYRLSVPNRRTVVEIKCVLLLKHGRCPESGTDVIVRVHTSLKRVLISVKTDTGTHTHTGKWTLTALLGNRKLSLPGSCVMRLLARRLVPRPPLPRPAGQYKLFHNSI